MKIVIDIPRLTYFDCLSGACDTDILVDAVANGTTLPKNHGDLIDRDELLNCSYEIDGAYTYEEVVHIDDVKQAPTIIEAEVSTDECVE